MSEQLREAAGLGSANGTAAATANGTGAPATKPIPQPAAGPTGATPPAAGPTAAPPPAATQADATQADAAPTDAGPTDAALRGAVRAAAEVAELVRDPAIRRIRVRVADIQIEVEGAEPGRDAVVGVTGDPAAISAATGVAISAGAGAAVAAVPGAAVAAVAPALTPPAGTVAVTAPLMGVFYRSPGPDQPPFVEIGQRVEAGDQVAIVEAMKMMNPVVTDRGGIVRAVHVTDGEVVEYEQPLLSVEPG